MRRRHWAIQRRGLGAYDRWRYKMTEPNSWTEDLDDATHYVDEALMVADVLLLDERLEASVVEVYATKDDAGFPTWRRVV